MKDAVAGVLSDYEQRAERAAQAVVSPFRKVSG